MYCTKIQDVFLPTPYSIPLLFYFKNVFHLISLDMKCHMTSYPTIHLIQFFFYSLISLDMKYHMTLYPTIHLTLSCSGYSYKLAWVLCTVLLTCLLGWKRGLYSSFDVKGLPWNTRHVQTVLTTFMQCMTLKID